MPPDLSVKQINALGVGRHRCARNLYLVVDETRRSWVMRYCSPTTGRQRDMGLGPADIISPARARELALRHRLTLSEGHDPLDERRAARPKTKAMTFREVARLYYDAHRNGWRNAKHAAQWISSLESYAFAVLGDLEIAAIGTAEIMRVLEPVWSQKAETASRVRGRVESVLDFAKARHWRTGENPARWRGHIENLLPARRKMAAVKHLAALPWRDLPVLWSEVADRIEMPALALKFTLLTAVRTGEALGATWGEVNLGTKLWTIPAARMKAGVEHVVPLSEAAIAVLDQLAAVRLGEHVFPGARRGRPLSDRAMLMLMRKLRPGVTVHGSVRAGFRSWTAAQGIPREMAKSALAHAAGDKVDQAYQREKLIPERARIMSRWARFLATPKADATVLPMVRPQEASG